MSPDGDREIGSDFDVDSIILNRRETNHLAHMPLVESGRQAITLLIRSMSKQNFDRVVFPTHHCTSMLRPFEHSGWFIEWSSVKPNWTMEPPILTDYEAHRTLIYSMSFFGVPESREWLEWVQHQRVRGARVLSDETHRLGGEWMPQADHHLASLRKMLPVPDGAVITNVPLPTRGPGTQGELRWSAMKLKSDQVLCGGARTYRDAFGRADIVTENDWEPALASCRTRNLLPQVGLNDMLAARTRNALALAESLRGGTTEVTTLPARIPSHAVLRHPRAAQLRDYLVSRSVFAPIHWPPSHRPVPGGWRSDIVSIPVDHRYTVLDMAKVGRMVLDFEREEAT